MRITGIEIKGVLGVSDAVIAAARPVTMIAGNNGAGKSSIAEAIRQAFTGENPRGVAHKKDFGMLLNDGAEIGFARVEWDGGGIAQVTLPKGQRAFEGPDEGADYLQYCADPQLFQRLDAKQRRAALFALVKANATKDRVKAKLIERGVDMVRADLALPLLAAGFDAACGEAQGKAREAKGAWKTATGGQTWGKDKAATWAPEPLTVDADKAAGLAKNAAEKVGEIDKEIAELNQQIGAARQAAQELANAASKRAELTDKAGRVKRITEKLERDAAERDEWRTKVADCRARAGEQPDPRNPGQFLLRGLAAVTRDFLAISSEFAEVQWPAELINRAAVNLAEYRKLHGEPADLSQPDPEAVANLPKWEQALSLMESAVRNGERDLAEALVAADELAKLGDPAQGGAASIDDLQAQLDAQKRLRTGWQTDADKHRNAVDAHRQRQKTIEAAAKHHADVMAWDAIAQAFAPDGIPAEFLAEAMGPFNALLGELSALAQWPTVEIDSDMRIVVGERLYEFRSESEKWRADAIIAAAIAAQSGLSFVMLDRFDVLDSQGREDALYWLDDMAADGTLESAIVLGTLKSAPPPGALPDNIAAFWIEAGKVGAPNQ